MTEVVDEIVPERQEVGDDRRIIDASVAFSRHFGNYGYELPVYAGSEDPKEAARRTVLKMPGKPTAVEIELQLRAESLTGIVEEFPEFADTTRNLDAALIKADNLAREKFWAVPDYSFVGVRNPLARRLLARLNIVILLDGSESDAVAGEKLKAGGDRIRQSILGPIRESANLSTVSDFDVVKAVYDGRIQLPHLAVS